MSASSKKLGTVPLMDSLKPNTKQRIEECIQKFGHSVAFTYVKYGENFISLGYTIGLADLDLPELMIFGIPGEYVETILNGAAARLKKGELPIDTIINDLTNLPVVFKEVQPSAAARYIIEANDRAGAELNAIQLIWPDGDGIFPWQVGFDSVFLKIQPVLSGSYN